ncbi:MAG: DUF1015 domain-containing protein [Chloroflexi bacterium]|nr:DUF1015 domain-containing protein [Chloroflexota bacterium]
MAEVRPLRGVRYNPAMVPDLAAVICPPHDVISPEKQQALYHRSEFNFVRIEYGWKLPQDTPQSNRYTRAAATLDQWLKQGVLRIEDTPAVYLHDHFFIYQGKDFKRRGITVRVRLEEWDRRIILPHEGTLSESRGDRLSLLWACRANTSPIFALYQDEKRGVKSLLNQAEQDKPIIDVSGADSERHRVWAITAPELVGRICGSFSSQRLYIADGHHRYESALAYRRERLAGLSTVTGDEGSNFVMMTLVDFADPGLLILPPHRLVRGLSASSLSELSARLTSFFDITELPLRAADVWQQVDRLLAGDADTMRLVLFGLKPGYLQVLTLRDFATASQLMPYFHTEVYKRLDVSVIDHIILEKLLGLSGRQEESVLAYSYDREDALHRVLDQEYQLAFILKPIKAETIKAIADAGDRMPRKSTYFYPKLPAGLVFNLLT